MKTCLRSWLISGRKLCLHKQPRKSEHHQTRKSCCCLSLSWPGWRQQCKLKVISNQNNISRVKEGRTADGETTGGGRGSSEILHLLFTFGFNVLFVRLWYKVARCAGTHALARSSMSVRSGSGNRLERRVSLRGFACHSNEAEGR